MDAVFYSIFFDYDKNQNQYISRSLAFYITDILMPWAELRNGIGAWERTLQESYGDHDWFMPCSGLDSIGFSSYDVDANHCDQLIQAWREVFVIESPGCVVSNVIEINETMSIIEIFEATKAAHEQQQAQKMRDTLTPHVSAKGSAAQQKKI
jgi:hypothetical protein